MMIWTNYTETEMRSGKVAAHRESDTRCLWRQTATPGARILEASRRETILNLMAPGAGTCGHV